MQYDDNRNTETSQIIELSEIQIGNNNQFNISVAGGQNRGWYVQFGFPTNKTVHIPWTSIWGWSNNVLYFKIVGYKY